MGDVFNTTQNRVYNTKETLEKKSQERKKNIFYLIKQYLHDQGLEKTIEVLNKEANLSEQIEVCDNIDLDTIIQEYTSYYFAKFNKYPKICKKIVELIPKRVHANIPTTPSKQEKSKCIKTRENTENFEISIKQISNVKILDANCSIPDEIEMDKPEMSELATLIKKEMVTKDLGVRWQDCVGLDNIIQLLKEAIVFPQLYPFLFPNALSSWKGKYKVFQSH